MTILAHYEENIAKLIEMRRVYTSYGCTMELNPIVDVLSDAINRLEGLRTEFKENPDLSLLYSKDYDDFMARHA